MVCSYNYRFPLIGELVSRNVDDKTTHLQPCMSLIARPTLLTAATANVLCALDAILSEVTTEQVTGALTHVFGKRFKVVPHNIGYAAWNPCDRFHRFPEFGCQAHQF